MAQQPLRFYKASDANVYLDGHEYSFSVKLDATNGKGDSQFRAYYKCAMSDQRRCQSLIRTKGEWEMDARGREFQWGVFESKNHNHERYQHLLQEDEKNADVAEDEAFRMNALFQQLIADAMKEAEDQTEEEKHGKQMPNKAEKLYPVVEKEGSLHDDDTPDFGEQPQVSFKEDDKTDSEDEHNMNDIKKKFFKEDEKSDNEDEHNMNHAKQKPPVKEKVHARCNDTSDSDDQLTPEDVMRLILGSASSSKTSGKKSNIGNRGSPKKGIFGSPMFKAAGSSPRPSGSPMSKRGGRTHQSASRLHTPSTPVNKPSSSVSKPCNRPHQLGDSVPKKNVHFENEPDVHKKKNDEPPKAKGHHHVQPRKAHRYSGDSCIIA